ncbi:MAG: glycine oxidase ThiO [Gammaproteobacteria bacterium]|nr:glycine oxidase ThiO [Gammaproteobacteria bacterium]
MFDYIVIGGGISALLSARELALSGARVAVLEKGQFGRESSWAGGGILSPLYPWRCRDEINVLARWSQQIYRQLAQFLLNDTGIDSEWRQSGLLMLALDDRNSASTWAQTYNIEQQVLSAEQLKHHEPVLSGKIEATGLLFPKVAQIRNPRLLLALRQNLANLGVELLEHHEVTELLSKTGRVTGVIAAGKKMHAQGVVITCGAWSAQLLFAHDINLPVYPVKGQMLLYQGVPDFLKNIVMLKDCYLIPRADGRILCGSTVENVGFNKDLTEEANDKLRSAAEYLIPELKDIPLERQWAGLRPGSATGIPYIGEVPGLANLYVNVGHYRNGVVLGPAAARLLADVILDRECIVDPIPYQLDV